MLTSNISEPLENLFFSWAILALSDILEDETSKADSELVVARLVTLWSGDKAAWISELFLVLMVKIGEVEGEKIVASSLVCATYSSTGNTNPVTYLISRLIHV